jgi:hypothetical protein
MIRDLCCLFCLAGVLTAWWYAHRITKTHAELLEGSKKLLKYTQVLEEQNRSLRDALHMATTIGQVLSEKLREHSERN